MLSTSPVRKALADETCDETYMDEPFVSIRWRSVPKILYAEWKGFATSEELRVTLTTVLRAIRERHVLYLVGDSRKAKVARAEDEIWVKEVWLPGVVSAGLKRMASVTAATGMGKMQREKFFEQAEIQGLAMRKFDSVPAATTWALTGLAQR